MCQVLANSLGGPPPTQVTDLPPLGEFGVQSLPFRKPNGQEIRVGESPSRSQDTKRLEARSRSIPRGEMESATVQGMVLATWGKGGYSGR